MSRAIKFSGRGCPTPSNRDEMNCKSDISFSLCLSSERSSFLCTPVLKGVGHWPAMLGTIQGVCPYFTQEIGIYFMLALSVSFETDFNINFLLALVTAIIYDCTE